MDKGILIEMLGRALDGKRYLASALTDALDLAKDCRDVAVGGRSPPKEWVTEWDAKIKELSQVEETFK